MDLRSKNLIDDVQQALRVCCPGEICYDIEKIPNLPGSYALILARWQDCDIEVGRLGHLHFKSGYYGYAGSAKGAGGLSSRLARHYRHEKAFRWHIDYLRAYADVIGVWLTLKGSECEIAHALKGLPTAYPAAPGFGASDCSSCDTHLLRLAGMTLVY